ncbi:hypothetical protein VaNZ11_013404 [Volvox africanus]|uniref:RAP domain-containing protein n=1 Tax=Volvox africanus TaxID=51714 RepID=A0ABQ5SGT0_9CHLO|nr:hypothetical protein VaNZ11_013404 [Volvox africanus]
MDAERWTSRWEPSGTGKMRPTGHETERGPSINRSSSSSWQTSYADREERWTKSDSSSTCVSRTHGRPSGGRDGGNSGNQWDDSRQHHGRYQPQPRRHQRSTTGPGANWVGRAKQEGVYDLETDLMGDAFGGLDPGASEAGRPTSGADGGHEVDPWSTGCIPNNDIGGRPPTCSTHLTLAQLEAAVSDGDVRSWSLERLAEAATAMCQLRSTSSPGQECYSDICPFSPREETVMDAIATAVIYSARHEAQLGTTAATATQIGWAVAQLLWACARGQYWCRPPKPQPGTWAGSAASAATAAAAVATVSLYGTGPAANGNGVGPGLWPSPAELRSHDAAEPVARASPVALAEGRIATDLAGEAYHPEESGGRNRGSGAGAGSREAGEGSSAESTRDSVESISVSHGKPLAVELMHWLSADGCRIVRHLDMRSLSLVWWALAKAAAGARARYSGTHLQPPATAAADILAVISPALVAALDARAIEELRQKNNAKLCALLYSCACVNKSSDQLLQALGDELAARLEKAIVLAEVRIDGTQRLRFSAREMSCIAYSCGLLGLRHEKLMAALSEYAALSSHTNWSASAISVFMYGIANVGHSDQRLMAWADIAISAKPALEFNLRNISFLLYNFHRLRWWPQRAAEHLLSATRLHAPTTIPLISISTILMCMGSGRARDERSLAHLCQALTQRPPSQLSCKDICICLTALQRLHGEDVLASQQPEVLAALAHLVDAIIFRGFSRPTPACRAVPVFNHQEVSNAMFALGKLKYYSPAVLDALRDHAARGGLEGASAWDCTAILVGLAQLNYGGPEDGDRGTCGARRSQAGAQGARGRSHGAAAGSGEEADVDLVYVLADTVARRARTAKSQDLANTLWALTVLEGSLGRYRSTVTTLLDEVNRRGPAGKNPDGFNVDEQRQLWQVHRELGALPQPHPSLREDLVRLGKLGMSEADHTYSRVQASFQSLLNAMYSSGRYPRLKDLLFEQELVPGGEQLMRIDVQAIIERPCPGGGVEEHRVAVEFDGPFHFMVNEPFTTRIDGRTALRNRILTRYLGQENLVCVSMAEWVAASREPPINGLPGRWRLMASKMGL